MLPCIYKRDEYIDGGNNSSIDLANVIVLNIPTKTIDSYGRQAMELTGSGTGYSSPAAIC